MQEPFLTMCWIALAGFAAGVVTVFTVIFQATRGQVETPLSKTKQKNTLNSLATNCDYTCPLKKICVTRTATDVCVKSITNRYNVSLLFWPKERGRHGHKRGR